MKYAVPSEQGIAAAWLCAWSWSIQACPRYGKGIQKSFGVRPMEPRKLLPRESEEEPSDDPSNALSET